MTEPVNAHVGEYEDRDVLRCRENRQGLAYSQGRRARCVSTVQVIRSGINPFRGALRICRMVGKVAGKGRPRNPGKGCGARIGEGL
jgi:hypothetical protein